MTQKTRSQESTVALRFDELVEIQLDHGSANKRPSGLLTTKALDY
jgi:hypothetical protein